MKDVWDILEHLREDFSGDIFVAEESLSFGFGVETEEYDYLLTSWGLGQERRENDKEEAQ